MTTIIIIVYIYAFGLYKGVDIFSKTSAGILEGLKIVLMIFPSILLLLISVNMLRASGALDFISSLLAPILKIFSIPEDLALIILIRPFSGTAALALTVEIIAKYGVESEIARIAAVMLGSSETTFYVLTVYFGSLNIEKTRWAVPAALFADISAVIMANFTVEWLF